MGDNHDHRAIHGAALPERCVIAVAGADRVAFLQGLVTQDVVPLAPGDMRYGLLLNPQGRFLHDFFLHLPKDEDVVLLETSASQGVALLKRLSAYKLRSSVVLTDRSADFAAFAFWPPAQGADGGALPGPLSSLAAPDPRLPDLGWRCLLRVREKDTVSQWINSPATAYAAWRVCLGVADGDEMASGQSLPAEYNLDHLSAISYGKGCYVGQEVTARLHYRALAKRRAFAVRGDRLPSAPAELRTAEGLAIGEMVFSLGEIGIAVLALDFVSALIGRDGQDALANPACFAIPLESGSMTLILNRWQRHLVPVNPLGKN